MLLVNPYAVLLVLPAAVLWPLARPGGWARSIVPVYLGLLMVPVPLIYYALQLDTGWKVWWYFFLLFENRTIPAAAVIVAALFLSTAGVLAHTLHERGLAPGALSWPAVDRRGPERLSDEEWAAASEAARAADAARGAARDGEAGGRSDAAERPPASPDSGQ